MFNVDVGIPGHLFNVTATNGITGTSAVSVSASFTGVSAATASSAVGRAMSSKVAITHFSGSSDIATLYTIESPAGTVLWQKYKSGTNNDMDENFDPPYVVNTTGGTVVFKAAVAATSKTQINAAGFEIASQN